MTRDSEPSSDGLELLSNFLDGTLDDAGLEKLRTALSSNPSAIYSLVDAAIVHDLLASRFADERSEAAAVSLLTSLGLAETFSASSSTMARRRKFQRLNYAVVGLAAAIVIAAGTFYWSRPSEIAAITRVFDSAPEATGLQVGVRLVEGERLQIERGLVEITFDSGAVMAVKAPADVELVNGLLARSRAGRITVDVGERARGFTVETPTANIVDWGTEFGVGVQGGETDVVVFDGMVDLHAKGSPEKRMHQGDALRVGSDGGLRRIISMNSFEFPIPNMPQLPGHFAKPVIAEVSDNIRGNQTTKCYRIVHGGLRDDATAYVDRSHQWNGIDESGLPSFLVGADYVMTFNDDKRARDLEVTVTLARDAFVYVLYDGRRLPPSWLSANFENTGVTIGLDEGPSRLLKQWTTGVGPGVSVDNPFRVWKRTAKAGEELVLGPQGGRSLSPNEDNNAMYGIAAVARDK